MEQPHPHHAGHVIFGVVGTALAATLGFHFLFYKFQYGFAFSLFYAILTAAVICLYMLSGRRGNAWSFAFLIPLGLALTAEALYASLAVRLFGFVIAAGSLAMFTYWLNSPSVPLGEVRSFWPKTLVAETVWPLSRLGAFLRQLVHGRNNYGRVLMGAALAAPFIVLIGLLFVSSDLLLQKSLNDIFTGDFLARLFRRSFWDLFALLYFLSAGWTAIMRIIEDRRPHTGKEPEPFDSVMITTFLAFLNLLFLVFIVYQFITLFGGGGLLEARGLTYSAYAREGFFQLLAVSAIVLAVVAGIYRYSNMRNWSVRWLSTLLVTETGLVIASALRRMALYIDAYGLSVLRYWATCGIILIFIAFVVVLFGMFTGQKHNQIFKSLAIGSLVLVSASLLINVEDVIVKFNFNRFLRGQTAQVDILYLRSLSADAMPALSHFSRVAWPNASPDPKSPTLQSVGMRDEHSDKALEQYVSDQYQLIRWLKENKQPAAAETISDWRGSTVSDYRALAAIATLE